jgi:hypothetical protein
MHEPESGRESPRVRWRILIFQRILGDLFTPVQFPPLFDFEMAHPSALDAQGVTALGVLPRNGPAELATFSTALGTTPSRDSLLHGVSEQFS